MDTKSVQKKIISSVVLLTLLANPVMSDMGSTASQLRTNKLSDFATRRAMALNPTYGTGTASEPLNIVIPAGMGSVVEQFKGTTQRTVVCIQDVHCNPEAQKNICAILHAVHNNGTQFHTVYREGAWGTLDMQWMDALPRNKRDAVIEQFVAYGIMTGVEKYQLMQNACAKESSEFLAR